MKLITKAVEKKLLSSPLYSRECDEPENVPVLVKFFFPMGNWTWYVTEAEKQDDGDWRFFGLVEGFEKELGYFTLSELQSVKKMGLGVERDMYFGGNHTLAEVM